MTLQREGGGGWSMTIEKQLTMRSGVDEGAAGEWPEEVLRVE